jgi:transposase
VQALGRLPTLYGFAGDTAREATSDEVKELKAETRQLKETLAEVLIENRLLKKRLGDGEDAS